MLEIPYQTYSSVGQAGFHRRLSAHEPPQTLLQNLNIHKASGPDRISTILLKETAEVTVPILKLIFERSFEHR